MISEDTSKMRPLPLSGNMLELNKRTVAVLTEHFVTQGLTSVYCYDGNFSELYKLLHVLSEHTKFIEIGGNYYQLYGPQHPHDTGGHDSHTEYQIRIEALDEDLTPAADKVFRIDTGCVQLKTGDRARFKQIPKGLPSRDLLKLAIWGGKRAVFTVTIKDSYVNCFTTEGNSLSLPRSIAMEILEATKEEPCLMSLADALEETPGLLQLVQAALEKIL